MIKKYICEIIIILVLTGTLTFGQSTVYYPLKKGNQFDYKIGGGPNIPLDFSVVIVGDTVMNNGLSYAIKMIENKNGVISNGGYERFSNDTVYTYNGANDNVSFVYFQKDTTSTGGGVKISYFKDSMNIGGHTFKQWNYERNLVGWSSLGWSYADSLGLTNDYSSNMETAYSRKLIAAIIDGNIYGTPRKTTLNVEKIKDVTSELVYNLEQNYPNPFNSSTKIKFILRNDEYVTLKVYDILGREIQTLVDGLLIKGEYQKDFNDNGLSTGIYIYRLNVGSTNKSKIMNLLK